MSTVFKTPADLKKAVGQQLGKSDWLEIKQDRIDKFADATGDHQWIHVDPERAKDGPFGACIAHGYLTQSLVNYFLPQIVEVQRKIAKQEGCAFSSPTQAGEALRTRQLCFAHAVYLEAIAYAVESGVGSRGSAIVLDERGRPIHEALDAGWRFAPENPAFRDKVLETEAALDDEGRPAVTHQWVPCRPIPETDAWFETAWARYREGEIYD
jgi:acyl dehydratase